MASIPHPPEEKEQEERTEQKGVVGKKGKTETEIMNEVEQEQGSPIVNEVTGEMEAGEGK